MDLFDLVATITLDTSQYEKKMGEAEGKAKKAASESSGKWAKFGKAAKVAGVATAAAVGAAAAGIGALTKKSVEAYAEYEQLVGGVKKLYGESADELMKYANEGYKTAGMSANKYMDLATSFSAALINSLEGDTSKAAKQTDVAMRAISDNFNTFGGDISNIQNAFQGFAKQNFSMLDNLKLGYGGTKTEMQRLIDDANEYAKSIGQAGDLSIDSFSDIVSAIDLVQQKQGIAGTTAKEAATTIQGALGMTKAAWDNLITGMADPDADMGQLMDNLIVAIVGDKEGEGLLNQLIPAVKRAIEGVGKFVEKAVPLLAQNLPSLIETFLPVAIQALTSLATSIIANLPAILKAIAKGLVQGVSILLGAVDEMTQSLEKAIKSGLQSIAGRVTAWAKQIPQKIKSGLGNLASMGRDMIEGLWNGIKSKFDSVIDRVKALAAKLPKAVKKVLGISSPSKVFAEVGKWIPEGLALGIEKNIGSVEDAANIMADATTFDTQAGSVGGTYTYNFNIYGAEGQPVKELAEEVRRIIIEQEKRRKVAWA